MVRNDRKERFRPSKCDAMIIDLMLEYLIMRVTSYSYRQSLGSVLLVFIFMIRDLNVAIKDASDIVDGG
jgi:hypothetical protein